MVSNITQPTQISNIYTHILIKNTFISICTICLLPSGGKCRVIRIDLETTVSVQGTTVKNGTFTRKNLTLSLLIRRRKRGYDSLKCKAVANCFHFAAARLEWTWKMKQMKQNSWFKGYVSFPLRERQYEICQEKARKNPRKTIYDRFVTEPVIFCQLSWNSY